MNVEDHAFNRAIRDTFAEATDISDVRAMEYGDTWNLDAMRDGLLALTLQLPQPAHLHREFIRLVRCAVMIDIKESRMAGEWKQDSLLDKLNYEAAFLQWHAAYLLAVETVDDPITTPSEGTHGYSRTGGTSCPGCTECAG